MSRLPLLSSESVINKLSRAGFETAPHRSKGSHTALYKTDECGRKLLVIMPQKNPVLRVTLLSILKQASLNKDEFLEL